MWVLRNLLFNMQQITLNLNRFKQPAKGENSAEWVFCDEVYRYFDKQLSFPMLRKFYREKGSKYMYETFRQVQTSKFEHKTALFMKLMRETKVTWIVHV